MPSQKRKFPFQVLLLIPAILLMLYGLWAGLQRMGWALPQLQTGLAALHGPLMIAGFLGTLLSLERAVALRIRLFYLAPLGSAIGMALVLMGVNGAMGVVLITLGSALMFVMMAYIVRQQTVPFTILLATGSAMWLVAISSGWRVWASPTRSCGGAAF